MKHSDVRVAEFLRHVLAGGAVAVAELEAKARAAGILGERQTVTNSKLFKAAKAALRIHSDRIGFGRGAVWFWALPVETVVSPLVVPGSAVNESEQFHTDVRAFTGPPRSDSICASDNVAARRRIPVEWIQGLAVLQRQARPSGISPHRWQLFLDDCAGFLDSLWAERAAELGWGTASLFGSCYRHPLDHLGSSGLLWNLAGGRIARLYKDGASILAEDGRERIFHRRPDRNTRRLPWSTS
jgi:hypothetical protein